MRYLLNQKIDIDEMIDRMKLKMEIDCRYIWDDFLWKILGLNKKRCKDHGKVVRDRGALRCMLGERLMGNRTLSVQPYYLEVWKENGKRGVFLTDKQTGAPKRFSVKESRKCINQLRRSAKRHEKYSNCPEFYKKDRQALKNKSDFLTVQMRHLVADVSFDPLLSKTERTKMLKEYGVDI